MAFYNCTALRNVKIEWATPLSVNDDQFRSVNISAATLHVPTGTKVLYEAAPVWKDFGEIVEYNPTHTEHIEVSTLNTYASNGILHISGLHVGEPIRLYSVSGQLVYSGIAKFETEQIPLNTCGIYFVVVENQTIKMIIE